MKYQFFPLSSSAQWEWVKSECHAIACEDSQGIVAYRNEKIVAAVVADTFTPDTCQVHIAISDPMVLRHGFLDEVGTHLFITCNRTRIFGVVPANNLRALKFDTNIGFTEVARVPNGHCTGIDSVVMVMERETSRWIKPLQEVAA
mgnify:FL=1